MSNEIVKTGPVLPEDIERAVIGGDLSKLTAEQRVVYHNAVCASVGLNPLTRPFDYLNLNGKLVLYAKRDATDQLRRLHGVNIELSKREKVEDVYIVVAKATMPDGRQDEATGAVSVAGLKGEALANAYMKAEAKAKRRVTLSICGMGMLDEGEVETIRQSQAPVVVTPLPKPAPATQPEEPPVIEAQVVETQPADEPGWAQFIREMKAVEWKKQLPPIKEKAKVWFKETGTPIPPEFIAQVKAIEAELP